MKKILDIIVFGTPKGQPRPRAFAFNGKARVFDPGTAEHWKSQIAKAVQDYLPEQPHDGPMTVSMAFYFKRPKSHYTGKGKLTKAAQTEKMYHTSKPDFDNLEKAVSDCLTEVGFWKDDSQVVQWAGYKFWTAASPKLELKITML